MRRVTEPVPAGKDTYMIGLGARGGLSNDAELLAQTIKAAGNFCAAQGRTVQVQSTSTSGVQRVDAAKQSSDFPNAVVSQFKMHLYFYGGEVGQETGGSSMRTLTAYVIGVVIVLAVLNGIAWQAECLGCTA